MNGAAIDLSHKKKVGLVLSGGAVKAAAFHVGVVLALEHLGFRFMGGAEGAHPDADSHDPSKLIRTYVGSSAGSLVTSFLAQGGSLKDLLSTFRADPTEDGIPGLKYWEMLFPRIRGATDLFDFGNFAMRMLRGKVIQSPFSTEGILKYLRTHVIHVDRFQELEPELFIVTTELNRSRKVIFGRYKSVSDNPHVEYRNDVAVSDACAASMALPPIYHPYTLQIDGQAREFYDGEIREPLSPHAARDVGCDLIICSYTHQPVQLSSLRKASLADRGAQEITLQAIYQSIEQKIRSARGSRRREKSLVDDISAFFKEKGLSDDLRNELLSRVESRMVYKPNVDYIYIHPKPTDQEMFLMPHFSLQRKHTENIVKRGYIAARSSFRELVLYP
jgi:predicted acylesterase/phospholipase RssA